MRRRLRAMENDGQLVFTKRKRYAYQKKLDLFKGTVIGHPKVWFLQVDGKRMICSFKPSNAKSHHGDFVLAQLAGLGSSWSPWSAIVRVRKP